MSWGVEDRWWTGGGETTMVLVFAACGREGDKGEGKVGLTGF